MSFKQIDFENDAIAWVCHYGSDMRNRYIIDGFFKTASLIYENVKKFLLVFMKMTWFILFYIQYDTHMSYN